MMKKYIFMVAAVAVALPVLAAPYAGYLYPTGVKAGSTVRVLVGGQTLRGIRGGIISGKGVRIKKVMAVPGFPNVPGTQHRYLVKWMQGIENGNPAKPPLPDEKITNEWRKCEWWDKLDRLGALELSLIAQSLFVRRNALQQTPSLRQMVILDIEADANAAPGVRELRLYSSLGVSAPKLFFVDKYEHYQEPMYTAPYKKKPDTVQVKSVPAVIDGQIMPGETDSFIVNLKADTAYTFILTGRRFQPFIGDAVPGHFQPVIRIIDPEGKEVAFADDEYFLPDPVMRFKSRKAGDYLLQVRDNLYRGRQDFVYRVAMVPGTEKYKISGHSFAKYDEVPEKEARMRILYIGRPLVISGTLANDGARDVFRFKGTRGMKFAAHLAARRDGSPLDGVLTLIAPDGKVIKRVDDTAKELNVGEILQQTDPELNVTLPQDGVYKIELTSLNRDGGRDHRYRLRLGVEEMDFNVYTVRSMCNIVPRGSGRVNVKIERTGGFKGDIRIFGDRRFVPSQTIKGDKKEFSLLLNNPAKVFTFPQNIVIYAEADINGRKVRKKVVPADIFNQAFAYDHLLPVRSFCIGSRRNWRRAVKKKPETAVKAPAKPAAAKTPAKPAAAKAPAPVKTPAKPAAAKK